MNTTTKKFLFPFFMIWIFIAWLVFKFGELLYRFGNKMSGGRFDNSVGKVYFD